MSKIACENVQTYPLVTVGIPTYNGGAKISKAVSSVVAQQYPNLEIIISDNCSNDDTEAICGALAIANPVVRYFRQSKNIGLMPNFQFVLNRASGNLFMWMSDDDYLAAGIIQRYVDFLLAHPDYALVSGRIQYWQADLPLFCEEDLSFEQDEGLSRILKFYYKVVYGSIFFGLMRTDTARQIPLKNRIGDDWHFVATLAFLGKIKNLEDTGYHKQCGGISKNFRQYAKTMQARPFSEKYPHLQIAIDAFFNIYHESPVYRHERATKRMVMAIFSFLSVFIGFYGKTYPFIVGGRIKRLLGLGSSNSPGC
jgi:glycosyltransferase involved in cell wall biosynthesis